MSTVALTGWFAAAAFGLLTLVFARRLELIARSEHELRGSFTAMSLAIEAIGREERERPMVAALETHVNRANVALADVTAGLRGRRSCSRARLVPLDRLVHSTVTGWRPAAHRFGRTVEVRWAAGPVTVHADDRRIAQAIGNLICNAVEHGDGGIKVTGQTTNGGVRVEVRDAGGGFGWRRVHKRGGRGLKIATQAVEEAGGTITFPSRGERGGMVAVDLPVEQV